MPGDPAAESSATRTAVLHATPCRYPSDRMLVRRGPGGELRYLRADTPEHEEYSYRRPFILELEITRRCNLSCVHCYAEAEDRAYPDELSLSEIRSLLDEARALGIGELSLTGGEVFLRPDALSIIDLGLERGMAVRLVTNGTLLDETLLGELCARPIKLITVSLDSLSPGPHERIRGQGSHAPALAALERLRAAGFRLSVITAFSAWNLAEFEPLLGWCHERRLPWQVQMTSAKGRCPRGMTLDPDGYYSLGEKVARALAEGHRLIPMDDLATFSQLQPLDRLGRTWQGQCTGGLLNLFVRASGDVTPCSALAFPESVVGNVRQEGLTPICLEERCRHNLAWLHSDALTGTCARCPFRQHCRGGCPEILLTMCASRTENEYCYHRIEEQRILAGALDDV